MVPERGPYPISHQITSMMWSVTPWRVRLCRHSVNPSFASLRWESDPRPLSYQESVLPLNYLGGWYSCIRDHTRRTLHGLEPNRRIELRASVYKTEALPLSELGRWKVLGFPRFPVPSGWGLRRHHEPVTGIEPAFCLYERRVIAIILYRRVTLHHTTGLPVLRPSVPT